MDILNEKNGFSSVKNTELEQVEKEKKEYRLIGNFLRKKGLNLYSYNPITGELIEINVKHKNAVSLMPNNEGKLSVTDLVHEEATIDPRNEHFHALNLQSAQKRVDRFKSGAIKQLSNLVRADFNSIKSF